MLDWNTHVFVDSLLRNKSDIFIVYLTWFNCCDDSFENRFSSAYVEFSILHIPHEGCEGGGIAILSKFDTCCSLNGTASFPARVH